MLKFIKKLNEEYDQLQEPFRFLVFFVPLIVMLQVAMFCPIVGWPLLLLLLVFRLIGKFSEPSE